MPEASLRDRAAALAGELLAIKNEAALAGDDELNRPLHDIRRIVKFYRGPFNEAAYDRLKERLADELYGVADSEERVLTARKQSLTASVRSTVEAELAAEHAELRAREHQAAEREAAVTVRERQARPSYRARFAAAGAGVVLVADVLLRVVA